LALDEVDIVGDQAEAVAHIYDSGCDAMTLLGCDKWILIKPRFQIHSFDILQLREMIMILSSDT
ncbi:MAG: hypothetical protein SPL49_04665, partial [Oribacterium sp.]|nr:hypothetical protein [Oribacterium sp.]